MLIYLARRLASGVVVFITVTALCYFLFYSRGAINIAQNILGPSADPVLVQKKAEALDLFRPLPVQYGSWLIGLVHDDLGQSFTTGVSVNALLSTRTPVTLSLVGLSLVLTVIFSVLLGVGAATRGGVIDRILQFLSVLAQALPAYWLALILVIVFSLGLRLFPATGYVPLGVNFPGWLSSVFLPSFAIALGNIAAVGQQLRGSMLDTFRQDYIRTLRSRGISTLAITYRHVLRNAAAPALSILSLQIIGTLGGAVIVERIFALPGLGSLVLEGGSTGDIPTVLGVVTIMVTVVVTVNLAVDLFNGFLNPKARLR